jgi:hypothetical protein
VSDAYNNLSCPQCRTAYLPSQLVPITGTVAPRRRRRRRRRRGEAFLIGSQRGIVDLNAEEQD